MLDTAGDVPEQAILSLEGSVRDELLLSDLIRTGPDDISPGMVGSPFGRASAIGLTDVAVEIDSEELEAPVK